jgi:membrane protein
LAGGIVAGLLFEAAKKAYTLYATNAISYSAIYGTMGAVPLFLLWIYVAWLVVLFGTEFSYGWQHLVAHQRTRAWGTVGQDYRELLGIAMTVTSVERFLEGKPGPDQAYLSETFDAPAELVEEILATLERGEVLVSSARGILPARALSTLTLQDVVAPLRCSEENGEPFSHLNDRTSRRVRETLAVLKKACVEPYREVMLAKLAEDCLDPSTPPPPV